MKRKNNFFKEFAFLILIVSGIAFVITVLLFLGKTGFSCRIDTQILDHFGSFVGGLFGSLLTFTSTLFLIYSINKQQEEIDKINDKEAENDFYNHLIKYLELYREQSKSYVFGDNPVLNAKYDNQFKYYLNHFKAIFESYHLDADGMDKNEYIKYVNKKYEDEHSLRILKEMKTNLFFIFKYVDENKFGEKYYQILKLFILKEEFIILYFHCLLLLEYNSKSKDFINDEAFLYEFYYKIGIPYDFQDNFLNSLMSDRTLIIKN
ncbi:hypothetical protein IF125_07475 [Empedobacter stercoris]|uniref:hypothetical protein n=1 Tax=Empedobacter stercoris TaxID=1628248 RepID=UPI001CE1D45F|nr:hypothetical protein [Empedobacter stercoris]MCA4782104.1 hypothetical protein [Empedobacter stercoris]